MRPQRLVLWDVDGTLLSAGPVAREVFGRAVEAVAHRQIGEHGVAMSGKTDPQIAMETPESSSRSSPGICSPPSGSSSGRSGWTGSWTLEVGAFGSDHHDRTQLIPIALRRVEQQYGWRLEPDGVWVIGDTPRDLECARAGGARCLLVATGRIRMDELTGIGADAVLADLADTDAVARLVMDGALPSP